MRTMPAWWAMAVLIGGCGGDARMEFSSADAIGAVASQMERTLEEYHQEVSRFDDTRESATVAAFIARVRKDASDQNVVDAHAADFEAALRKIRTDRETEWSRRTAALDNLGVLREVSRGVQKLAIQSMGLQDELKRYLEGWIEARQRARTAQSASATQSPTEDTAQSPAK